MFLNASSTVLLMWLKHKKPWLQPNPQCLLQHLLLSATYEFIYLFKAEGKTHVSYIVTWDESLAFHHIPASKRPSMQYPYTHLPNKVQKNPTT